MADSVWGFIVKVGGSLGFAALVFAFFQGMAKKAGESTTTLLLGMLKRKPREPVEVDGKFVATHWPPGLCAWVREVDVFDYEAKGYTRYTRDKKGGPIFRISGDQHGVPRREFLLVQPGAIEVKSIV